MAGTPSTSFVAASLMDGYVASIFRRESICTSLSSMMTGFRIRVIGASRMTAVATRTLSWSCAAAAVIAGTARAQASPIQQPSVGCDYSNCALTIEPTWNGLAIARGTSGTRVANLSFFFPHDIASALSGSDASAPGSNSVRAEAAHALSLRRIGAPLTDVGLGLIAIGAVRAITVPHDTRTNATIAGIGAASLGLSVPFQFAADGALSRAVWWHNLRFAR